jgi:hypothetical protein
MYVADSLFFVQHLYTNPDDDEDHGSMFSMKLRDILQQYDEEDITPSESADDIKNRMIEKSLKLSGN